MFGWNTKTRMKSFHITWRTLKMLIFLLTEKYLGLQWHLSTFFQKKKSIKMWKGRKKIKGETNGGCHCRQCLIWDHQTQSAVTSGYYMPMQLPIGSFPFLNLWQKWLPNSSIRSFWPTHSLLHVPNTPKSVKPKLYAFLQNNKD